MNSIIVASLLLTIQAVSATEVTLTLSDAELSTEFAYKWGPGTVTAIEDIPGLGVRFNFTGLGSSGTGVCDDYPVSSLAGGDPDNIGGYGDFRKYTQYRLVFTNLGPSPVSVNIDMNTGWTTSDPTRDTYWENSWTYLDVGESKVVTLDFSNAICWNAEDDPVPEWRYPGGTSGVIVRRLSEVSRIGFQVAGSGDASVVVSATIPKDTVVTLPDEELATQFAKETGPGTVDMITNIPGYGVRFDFSGLSTSVGTVVGDSFPVSALAGGAWKDYGSGFAGPYDFSGYDRFSLLFINVGTKTVMVNLKINTGWTDSPWGSPEKDTFWQNSWTTIAPGESRVVTLDFWSAEVWNAMDDPVPEWRYPDGTTGVIVQRLDELSDIGFQILGDGAASIIVSGDLTLGLSDDELSSEFAYEWGPGTVTAITDVPGPGVRFDFSGLSTSVGTGVGDNFPVSALAGGAYKTYGVTQPFSTWGDFSGYNKYSMIFTNIGTTTVMVNLKINTGWTIPPPEYAKAWRDTFWQNGWTTIAPGETKTVTLNFSSAEVWNAGDEQEYVAHPDGTTGVAVWRLDELSDIGFQILGDGTASIIISSRPLGQAPTASFTYSPLEPKVGEVVMFNASTSMPNGGEIIDYEWDFGDGNITSTSEPIITHLYSVEGTYNVTLTVIDNEDLNDTTWQLISVVPAVTYVHDVAITQIVATPTMVEIGEIVEIRVTVKNLGNATETFNVTTNYGSLAEEEHVVDLEPGSEVTFGYTWDTSSEDTCLHTVSALAHPVEGETFIYNNFRSTGIRIVNFIPEHATLKVEPSIAKGLRDFDVNVTINDLDAYWDMAGFDVILYYNTTMLDVVEVELGSFAKNFNLTFQILHEINDAEGYIHLAYMWDFVSLLPEERPTPYGSGVLFAVTFAVVEEGEDYLSFGDVTLAAFGNATKWCVESPIPIYYVAEDGTVKTVLPWKEDVNADGKIDLLDIVLAATAYASRPGDPHWNPYADIDQDGVITILDIVSITRIYGLTYDP